MQCQNLWSGGELVEQPVYALWIKSEYIYFLFIFVV